MKMKYRNAIIPFVIAIVTILVIVFYVVDTSDRSISEHRDSETEQLEDQKQAAKVTATTEDPSIETDKTDSKSTHDPNKSSPISEEFTIQDDLFIHGAAAPEYIDEDQIVFSLDQDRSYIISIDKRTETWEILYETSNQEIINSLVGYEKQLFWVEYPRQMDVDTPWVMKTMDLNNKKIHPFQNGVAKDYTLPPVLRVFENQLTWIDKIMKGDIMISTALVYDIETGLIEEVASEALDERDKEYRDGVFFILQRPVVDGMLIHQSVFTPDKTSDERTFELVHYPYDPEAKPQKIADNAEQIIDFTSDYDWIVLCEYGRVRVIDRKTRTLVHEIRSEMEHTTFDSPFILEDQLYVRQDMDQILNLDLKTGEWTEVLKSKETLTKIYNSHDYLGFTHLQTIQNDGTFQFFIIEKES